MKTMKGAGYDVRESDPFARGQVLSPLAHGAAPIVGRIWALASLRDAAMEGFPPTPGLSMDKEAYLRFVDEIYQSDAYHLAVDRRLPRHPGADREGPRGKLESGRNRGGPAEQGHWPGVATGKLSSRQPS
jgi:hypothetical protein